MSYYKTAKKILFKFLVNRIFSGTKIKYFEMKRNLLNNIGYEIGEGTKIVGPLFCDSALKIGKNCWIGSGLTIHGNGIVSIGDNCDFAPDITFLTGGHEIGSCIRRAGNGQSYSIRVGNGVWIGAKSTIGKNITIGNGSVIAACACVMKDVPENKLVAGVPAKVIRGLECERASNQITEK